MTKADYWAECLASSFEEHGVAATNAQIEAIARDVEGARDCMSMAFHVPESPLIGELKAAQAALKREQSMVTCEACKGSGRDDHWAGQWWTRSECGKCRGAGRHVP